MKRFQYLHTVTGALVGCLAIQWNPNTKSLEYQYSALNPVDKFDKEVGLELANKRLEVLPIALKVPSGTNHWQQNVAIMKNLSRSKAPTRLVKAAKRWLLDHGATSEPAKRKVVKNRSKAPNNPLLSASKLLAKIWEK